MLDRINLKTKIILLTIISLIGMIVLVSISAIEMRDDLTEARKLQIKSVTEALYNTVTDFQAQEAAGKLSREQAQKLALEAARTARFGGKDGKTEYFYFYTMGGVNIFHIKKELIGQDLREKIRDGKGGYPIKDLLAAIQTQRGAFVDSYFARPGSQEPVPKLQYVMHVENWDWMIGTGIYMDDIEREYHQRLAIYLSVAGLILIGMGLFAYAIARGVLRQVGGEPDQAISIMSRIAAGDLSGRRPPAARGSILGSMNEMVGSIREMVGDIGRNAGHIMQGAQQISNASSEVATASHRQSEATSSMAAAIEEMTVSISHISDNAKETEDNALSSVKLTEEGFQKVESAASIIKGIATSVSNASTGIRQLEERAGQISSITGVIKEIAGQTNLLALNAAIEAARAGEQGRGFAVVADEVRKLAERTSSATVEIETMIAAIQNDTEQVVEVMDAALPQVEAGVEAANQAAESLQRIKEGTQAALERIRDVSSSTREQSIASTNIAQKVEEIATMVEETSSSMQSAAATAEGLEKIATELNGLVGRFRC